jgi:hypothetical protein
MKSRKSLQTCSINSACLSFGNNGGQAIELETHEKAIGSPMSPRLREFNNQVVGTEHDQGIDVWLNAKDTAGKVVRGLRSDIFFD